VVNLVMPQRSVTLFSIEDLVSSDSPADISMDDLLIGSSMGKL
jgi:hypothetical protein